MPPAHIPSTRRSSRSVSTSRARHTENAGRVVRVTSGPVLGLARKRDACVSAEQRDLERAHNAPRVSLVNRVRHVGRERAQAFDEARNAARLKVSLEARSHSLIAGRELEVEDHTRNVQARPPDEDRIGPAGENRSDPRPSPRAGSGPPSPPRGARRRRKGGGGSPAAHPQGVWRCRCPCHGRAAWRRRSRSRAARPLRHARRSARSSEASDLPVPVAPTTAHSVATTRRCAASGARGSRRGRRSPQRCQQAPRSSRPAGDPTRRQLACAGPRRQRCRLQ